MAASYTRLTCSQKEAMRTHSAANSTMTHQELAQWALATFRLRRPPSRTTLHRVLKAGPADQVRTPSRKTVRPVTCPALDEALVEWIGKCERWALPIVTGGAIREKAAKIRDGLIATASPIAAGAVKTMAFSNGWLGKVMNRHHLTSRRMQGEAASVDLSAVEKGRAARCVQHGRDCLFLLHAAEQDDLLASGVTGRSRVTQHNAQSEEACVEHLPQGLVALKKNVRSSPIRQSDVHSSLLPASSRATKRKGGGLLYQQGPHKRLARLRGKL